MLAGTGAGRATGVSAVTNTMANIAAATHVRGDRLRGRARALAGARQNWKGDRQAAGFIPQRVPCEAATFKEEIT
jgi:hypothetical protein